MLKTRTEALVDFLFDRTGERDLGATSWAFDRGGHRHSFGQRWSSKNTKS